MYTSTTYIDSVASNRFWTTKLEVGVFVFLLAHIPLALFINSFPSLGIIHAFGVLAVGLWYSVFRRDLAVICYVGAYIVSGEVLWRMTDAVIWWEFAKYAIGIIFLTAILRGRFLK